MNKIKGSCFKKILLNTFLWLTFSATANQTDVERFSQAIEFSKAGKFDAAINNFLSLPHNFKILVNVASCFYAKGDFARALLYLKKAQKTGNFFERLKIVSQIELVQKKLGFDLKKDLNRFAKFRAAISKAGLLLLSISSFWLEVLLVIFWVLLMFAFKYVWRRRVKFVLLSCLSCFLLGLFLTDKTARNPLVVIVASDAEVFSGPGKHFLALEKAIVGSEVYLTKQQGEYFKVKIGKKSGWIHAENLEKI